MAGARYKIVRFFRDDHASQVIKKNLTLAEAKAHCHDPETSSSTAKSAKAVRLTDSHGPWFDGFSEM